MAQHLTLHSLKPEDLPSLPPLRQAGRDVTTISTYLENLLSKEQAKLDKPAFLPSLMSLAWHLKTSPLEVQNAFQHLRGKGYDYLFQGLDCPITCWCDGEMDKHAASDGTSEVSKLTTKARDGN